MASFYLVPAVFETRWVNISEVLAPGLRPQDNFLFTNIADPEHNQFNRLVSTIAAGEIAALVLAMVFPGPAVRTFVDFNDFPESSRPVDVAFPLGNCRCAGHDSGDELPVAASPETALRTIAMAMAAMSQRRAGHAADRGHSPMVFPGAGSVVLLAVVLLAGYRIQPPWWDTAADIQEMSEAMISHTGYEGTDEYVPAGADPYELKKDAPLVTDALGSPQRTERLEWGPVEKRFVVHSDTPGVADSATLQLSGVGGHGQRETGCDPNHRSDRANASIASARLERHSHSLWENDRSYDWRLRVAR